MKRARYVSRANETFEDSDSNDEGKNQDTGVTIGDSKMDQLKKYNDDLKIKLS